MASRSRRTLSARAQRQRAAAALVVAVLVGIGVAVLLHGGGGGTGGSAAAPPPGTAPGQARDPLRYRPARQAAFAARAAAGLAHVLYAKSPGGAEASAARVAALRPLIVKAAGDGKVVDADTLEGIVLLESAGRPEAQASPDLDGAVGLTQILAETATSLLKMKVDVAASTVLTKEIAKGGPKLAAREALRRRVDERFDPAKALAGTVRYLAFARGELANRPDLAVASYHMGVGNLQSVLAAYGGGRDVPYAELFFASTPLAHAAAQAKLASFGDDSSTYLWRVDAAKAIMRLFRSDPSELARLQTLQTNKNSAEEVLHPGATTQRFRSASALQAAEANGTLKPLSAATMRSWGMLLDPSMGELAPRLKQPRARYRALRPEALAVMRYLGDGVKAISAATQPLRVTSSVRDDAYQRLLTLQNIEATKAYSLHTTGYTFDVLREYQTPSQALAFQFLLDRLTDLNLIAWVREPAAIHITVAADAAQALLRGP